MFHRRGLAPVVSVILLVLIVIVAGGGTYVWITSIIVEEQAEAAAVQDTNLAVRDVSCKGLNATITFSNSGDRGLDSEEAEVYLYSQSTANLIGATTVDVTGKDFLDSGGIGTVEAGFSTTTEKGKAYRLTVDFPADDYTAETTCESQGTVVGEVHRVSLSSSTWTALTYKHTHDQPLVLMTVNTQNSGDDPMIPQVRNVQSTSAEVRLCEHEGSDGCANAGTETAGVVVLDMSRVNQLNNVEAGNFTIQTGGGSPYTQSHSFTSAFNTAPIVFVTPQTVNGTPEFSIWVTSTSTTGFTVARCDHNETGTSFEDQCTNHGPEEAGWMAVNPNGNPFQNLHADRTDTEYSGTSWANISYPPLSNPVAALGMIQGDDGGQDPKVSEIDNATRTWLQAGFCEHDTGDSCDGHADNFLAWLATPTGFLLH